MSTLEIVSLIVLGFVLFAVAYLIGYMRARLNAKQIENRVGGMVEQMVTGKVMTDLTALVEFIFALQIWMGSPDDSELEAVGVKMRDDALEKMSDGVKIHLLSRLKDADERTTAAREEAESEEKIAKKTNGDIH